MQFYLRGCDGCAVSEQRSDWAVGDIDRSGTATWASRVSETVGEAVFIFSCVAWMKLYAWYLECKTWLWLCWKWINGFAPQSLAAGEHAGSVLVHRLAWWSGYTEEILPFVLLPTDFQGKLIREGRFIGTVKVTLHNVAKLCDFVGYCNCNKNTRYFRTHPLLKKC